MFKDRLRELRIEKNMNQVEFSKYLNVAKQTVSNWENGNRMPDSNMLIKLANFFDVTIDYLLGRTNIRDAVVYENNINGKPVHIEYKERSYPDGLTYNQVVDILKKLKEAGVNLNPQK